MTSLSSLNEIIAFSLSILLVILYYKVYRRDTEVGSLFFTVDTSRTMRFMQSYIVAIGLFVIGLYFILPFMVFALVAVIALTIFFALNIIILIFNILLFLFGTRISFINFEIFSVITDFEIIDFAFVYFEGSLIIIQFFLFVITPVVGGWQCGKYAEDKKSIKIIGLTWIAFLGSQALLFANYNNKFISGIYILGIIVINYLIFLYLGSVSYGGKSAKEEYDLSEITGWKYYAYFSVGFLSLIPLLSPTFVQWYDVVFRQDFTDELYKFLIVNFITLVSLIFVVLNILFYLRGDHPVHQKIAEIENREDLIEMAKEFRELDPSNIDDFVRKSSSGLM